MHVYAAYVCVLACMFACMPHCLLNDRMNVCGMCVGFFMYVRVRGSMHVGVYIMYVCRSIHEFFYYGLVKFSDK